MKRIDGANPDTDAFGSGKDGYRTSPPYTTSSPVSMNHLQEEICRVIEGFGVALNPASYTQLFDAITGPGRTDVVQASASTAVFGSSSKPNEHPGSASNRWKEIWSALTNQATNTRVRFLVGDGDSDGTFAITFNAFWNCGSGAQNWQSDNTGAESAIMIQSPNGLMQFQTRAAGGGTWTSWTDASINALDVTASGDVKAGSDFEYISPPTRTICVPIKGTPVGTGATLRTTDSSTWELPGNTRLKIDLDMLPRGAVLATLRILYSTDGGGAVDWSLDLQKRSGFNFSVASIGTKTSIASNSGTLASGLTFEVLTGLATTIAANEVYWLDVGCGVGSVGKMWITGMEIVFSDPGPRNI